MTIFNSYVKLPEGKPLITRLCPRPSPRSHDFSPCFPPASIPSRVGRPGGILRWENQWLLIMVNSPAMEVITGGYTVKIYEVSGRHTWQMLIIRSDTNLRCQKHVAGSCSLMLVGRKILLFFCKRSSNKNFLNYPSKVVPEKCRGRCWRHLKTM